MSKPHWSRLPYIGNCTAVHIGTFKNLCEFSLVLTVKLGGQGRRFVKIILKRRLSARGNENEFFDSRFPWLCCTNGMKDFLFESSMIAGGYEQLDPDEVQDHELVGLQ